MARFRSLRSRRDTSFPSASLSVMLSIRWLRFSTIWSASAPITGPTDITNAALTDQRNRRIMSTLLDHCHLRLSTRACAKPQAAKVECALISLLAPLLDLKRRADGAQDRLICLQFLIVRLTQDQQDARLDIDAARPASIGQVEAEELHIVANGHLAGERLDSRRRLQPRILRLQGAQRRLGDLLGAGAAVIAGQRQERRPRTLQQDAPAVFALLAVQPPVVGITERHAVVVVFLAHDSPPLFGSISRFPYAQRLYRHALVPLSRRIGAKYDPRPRHFHR